MSQLPTLSLEELATAQGGFSPQLERAMQRARELGLTITSTTGGNHGARSLHYEGRAFDASGSPAAMAQLYDEMLPTNPNELFYDPKGGWADNTNIGAIGGHGDHIHVGY